MNAGPDSTADFLASELRRNDRDRFVTALFAPALHRPALIALYAFNQELAQLQERVREPILGEMRLQWWRDTIDGLAAGGDVAHPVAQALGPAIREYRLSPAHLHRMIDARAADLDPAPFPDAAALEAYAEGSTASLVVLALEVLGVRGAAAEAAARHAGIAWATTGILRAAPYQAAAGRNILSQELLAAHGLEDGIEAKGGTPPGLIELARDLAGRAERAVAAARALRPELPREAAPALLIVAMAETYLGRLRRAGFDLADAGWSAVRPPVLRLTLLALRGRY